MSQLLYQIALTLIPGVGDVLAKNLLAYSGSAEAVFKEKVSRLSKIPGIGRNIASQIVRHNTFDQAEKEVAFVEKNGIQPLFFSDNAYPTALKQCVDSPVLLYYKGNKELNHTRFVSIVGTRNASDYGIEFTQQLISDLEPYNVCVVSGLAYGIDSVAHKAAIKNNMATIGVLAHGLDRLYPSVHRNIAKRMLANGGLLTEFLSGTNPDKENFPKRNRIVAGLSEATIVVEAAKKGGALITAEIANSYNRDVFALPGRVGDTYSEGCNTLIKVNKAALIQSIKDIEYILGWSEQKNKSKSIQKSLIINLSSEEKSIVNAILEKENIQMDHLSYSLQWPVSKVFAVLTSLELKGIVKCNPGKVYSMV